MENNFYTPKIEEGKEKENKDLMYLKLAENCFKEASFGKAVILMENIDEDVMTQRAMELLGGSDDEKELAEEMYIKKKWQKTAEEITREKERIKKENFDTKMIIDRKKGGVRFKAENPRFVLLKAEEDFNEGYLFKAWWKTKYVDPSDIESRKEELLNGTEEEQDLAKKMYVGNEWMEKVEKKWRETDVRNDREFREKKWEADDL